MKRLLILIVSLLAAWQGLSAQNTARVRAGAERIVYNPMIFGGFLEHFDTQVSGGVYCPGSPLSD